MKKTLPLLFFFAVFALSFVSEDTSHLHVFELIDKEVRAHSRAYESLREATVQIGHRLTGSPNGERAEELAFGLFRQYGFRDVQFQPFEVEAWVRDTVTLSIAPANSDNYREVPVVALAHSPVEANIAGEIVDAGDGLSEDFEAVKEKIRGKVALVNIGVKRGSGKANIHRSQKAALAIQHGAVGVIMVNQAPGEILLTGTASVTGVLISIPAVCISNHSGKELRAWMAAENPLISEISMRNFSKKIKARNVIATLKGKSKDKIVIGGHLDSWDLATGAIDNGIGSFAVMDIARTFHALKLRPEKTIEFVMFMGEEQGLLGSKHFVKELQRKQEIDRVSYMVNLDMTNDPNGVNTFGRAEMETFFKHVGGLVSRVDTSYRNAYMSRAGLHSDHQPFMLEGIPVLSFSGTLSPDALDCYHADCDDFDLVRKDQLEKTVRITSMYLYALAAARDIPARRLSAADTRDLMIGQGLRETLLLGNEWKWAEK